MALQLLKIIITFMNKNNIAIEQLMNYPAKYTNNSFNCLTRLFEIIDHITNKTIHF